MVKVTSHNTAERDTQEPNDTMADVGQDPLVDDEEEQRRRERQAEIERFLLAQEAIAENEETNAARDAAAVQENVPLVQPLVPPPALPEQPKPLRALSYTQTSLFAAACLLFYALRTRQQWYLALVYLSSSKAALVVMGNALTAAAVSSFDLVINTFLKGLRRQEAEGLQDFFRWNVTETCLALTMFRTELTAGTGLQFLALITAKCLHHVAVLREQHVRMTQDAVVKSTWTGLPTIPMDILNLLGLLLFLQALDISALQYTVQDLLTNGPTVSILFSFEAAILLVSAWSHILLWSLHVVDSWLNYCHDEKPQSFVGRLVHPWKEYKATLIFAVELQAQAIQFLFYLMFFGIVLTYYGMPINLFREVYMSFVSLMDRLGAFLKYRRLMASMNRFADVSEEQLDEAGRTCIICRDDMHRADCKQLPACKHCFHKSCLREWLVQQQSCPTCRSDISVMQGPAPVERREVPVIPEVPEAPVVQAPEPEEPVEEEEQVEDEMEDREEVWQNDWVGGTGEGEDPPEAADETRAPPSAYSSRRDKRVRFNEEEAALDDPNSPSFPALYRVVRVAGASVYSDSQETPFWVRTVPFGVVVLCQELKEQEVDGEVTVLLRIPDGWIPEDSVLHVHTLKR